MNKIYIHKGDSTIFADCNKFLTFTINTDLDLTGWKAKFILGYITKEIKDISSKTFGVELTSAETNQLKYGSANGAIILIDKKGNTKTIINTIPFEITNEVIENEYQEIDLSIPESSGVDIILKVGSSGGSITSVNGMTGDVVLTAQDVGALPADTVIPDVSDFVTKEEIPNLDGLVTQEELEAKGYMTYENINAGEGVTITGDDETGITISASGGGGSVDTSNLVDLTNTQTINANKTIGYGKELKFESGTTSYNGAVYGGTGTAGNMILECQNQTGATPEKIILGAQGSGSNYSRRGIFLSVPTNEAIYLGAVSSACKVEAVNDLNLWGGYKQNSYLTLSNDEVTYTKSNGQKVDLLNGFIKGSLLTQAEYDALATKDPNTLYLIKE